MDRGVRPERTAEPRPKSIRPELEREHDVAQAVGLSVQAFWRLPEAEQDIWRARFDREQGRCPHCGNQRDACSDPDVAWYPQLTICYATRERVAAQRRFESLHKDAIYHNGAMSGWRKEPSRQAPYHLLDGATVWVAQTDLGLGGDFLGLESKDD